MQTEREIYVQCPKCKGIHNLNKVTIFPNGRPKKDRLEKLKENRGEHGKKKGKASKHQTKDQDKFA
jgi:hypothetical protein